MVFFSQCVIIVLLYLSSQLYSDFRSTHPTILLSLETAWTIVNLKRLIYGMPEFYKLIIYLTSATYKVKKKKK